MRLRVNPDNPTEIWATFDGREPTEDDKDFGADFYFYRNEIEVGEAVEAIVAVFNTAAR